MSADLGQMQHRLGLRRLGYTGVALAQPAELWGPAGVSAVEEQVAEEVPVALVYNGVPHVVMMATRRQFHKNLQNTKDILVDLQVMMTMGPKRAAERANSRRKDWVRLPYGVPLCVGLLGYLGYKFFLA